MKLIIAALCLIAVASAEWKWDPTGQYRLINVDTPEKYPTSAQYYRYADTEPYEPTLRYLQLRDQAAYQPLRLRDYVPYVYKYRQIGKRE